MICYYSVEWKVILYKSHGEMHNIMESMEFFFDALINLNYVP